MLGLVRASGTANIPSSFAPGSSSSTLLRGGASSSGMSTMLNGSSLDTCISYTSTRIDLVYQIGCGGKVQCEGDKWKCCASLPGRVVVVSGTLD
jgi:hypothetical protein